MHELLCEGLNYIQIHPVDWHHVVHPPFSITKYLLENNTNEHKNIKKHIIVSICFLATGNYPNDSEIIK